MSILKKVAMFVFLFLTIPFLFSKLFSLIFINVQEVALSIVAEVIFLIIYFTKHLIRRKIKSKKVYFITLLLIYTLAMFVSFIVLLALW